MKYLIIIINSVEKSEELSKISLEFYENGEKGLRKKMNEETKLDDSYDICVYDDF